MDHGNDAASPQHHNTSTTADPTISGTTPNTTVPEVTSHTETAAGDVPALNSPAPDALTPALVSASVEIPGGLPVLRLRRDRPSGRPTRSGAGRLGRGLSEWMRSRVLPRRGMVRALGFNAVRMAHRWPWRPGVVGGAMVLLGWAFTWMGWPGPGHRLQGGGMFLVVAVSGWWWVMHVVRPHSTKAAIKRRAALDQRSGGVATILDVAEHAGPTALRGRASILRPSTAGLTAWQRRRLDPTELGVLVATTGWGRWGQQVWSANEDATLRIGGPRTYKTISLAAHAEDAPGALVTTSTRLDLAEMVHAARSARGAVHFFNPAGLGGLPSTLRWRVLTGCEDFATASRRATDLIPATTGEAERWDTQARRILSLLLHAAALANATMRDVIRWTADATPDTQHEITTALLTPGPNGTTDGARDRVAAMRAFWATNDRTRTSITTTMSVPLAWMSDDRARALGDTHPHDPHLINITDLITRGQTLHLIGHEDHTALSPLIAALIAEIAHAARTLAANRPAGRLDPPLTLVLDEAAIAAPVPLDRWTADMGGRGVTIHISVQSLAQLRERWGDDPAAAILANVASFLVFGGSPTAADLRDISSLTGEHRMRVLGADHNNTDAHPDTEQRSEHRWVPVLSPAQIRALEPGQVLLLRRGLHTFLGWAPKITDRPGWTPTSLTNRTPDTPGNTRTPTNQELEHLTAPTTSEPTRTRPNAPTAHRIRNALHEALHHALRKPRSAFALHSRTSTSRTTRGTTDKEER